MTNSGPCKKVTDVFDRVAPAMFGMAIGILIIGILIKKDIKYSINKALNKESK